VAGQRSRTPRPPRARCGQHFLASRALVASIVEGAGVQPGDVVLDLGAGHGIVTGALASAGARVVAVETDARLVTELRNRFGGRPDVTVLATDARTLRPPDEAFRVVANLPFDGGTAILRRLLDDPRVPLRSADVVLEWAVAAKRSAVWPSTLLGAFWGAWHELSLARRLPRSAFVPPPAVDAGLLRVRRRATPLVDVPDARRYRRFLERAYGGGLRAAAPRRVVVRLAGELGFDRDARPRDLDAAQLAALFHAVRHMR
jgi:23S rRNA (adenine-N6)-dimethyltransferase